MVSETTAALVRDKFIMRPLDVVRVKGKLKPMAVYEVLAEVTGVAGNDERPRALAERFGAAFKAYQAQRWDEAEGLLRGILVDWANDPPSLLFLDRVAKFRAEPPGLGWDGVYKFKDK
jgi:adenylate cyclase